MAPKQRPFIFQVALIIGSTVRFSAVGFSIAPGLRPVLRRRAWSSCTLGLPLLGEAVQFALAIDPVRLHPYVCFGARAGICSSMRALSAAA